MLDSAQLSAVMKTGGSARENNKNPVHWRGAPMVRGLIGNQVFGKLNCRFESCSLRHALQAERLRFLPSKQVLLGSTPK